MCLWLNFIPFGQVWIALGRPYDWRVKKKKEKSEALQVLFAQELQMWDFFYIFFFSFGSRVSSVHSVGSESVPTCSDSGCYLTCGVTEWESVDKESDVKNQRSGPPPSRYERGCFLRRYATLKEGQFYLWLCNGMKEQLCSPLQGGSVYPDYLINAPLASCCYGARS